MISPVYRKRILNSIKRNEQLYRESMEYAYKNHRAWLVKLFGTKLVTATYTGALTDAHLSNLNSTAAALSIFTELRDKLAAYALTSDEEGSRLDSTRSSMLGALNPLIASLQEWIELLETERREAA